MLFTVTSKVPSLSLSSRVKKWEIPSFGLELLPHVYTTMLFCMLIGKGISEMHCRSFLFYASSCNDGYDQSGLHGKALLNFMVFEQYLVAGRLRVLSFLFQHLLKVQEEYKKREAELEKVKEDKLKIETLLENLKEQVCAIQVFLVQCLDFLVPQECGEGFLSFCTLGENGQPWFGAVVLGK